MNDLQISNRITIPLNEIELNAIRSQGSGGQNINKVATGIHLRFDIQASTLPPMIKQRLLQLSDQRLSKDGVIVIKSQQSRSQEQNRQKALDMLQELVKSALVTPKKRKQTKPPRATKEKRLEQKLQRGQTKNLRRKVID